MSMKLQIVLLLGMFASIFILVRNVKRTKINVNYSIVWFLGAFFLLICAIFPEKFYQFSHDLGFDVPVNLVFLMTIFSLYCLCYYLFRLVSEQNNKIVNLTYKVAELEKRMNEEKSHE